MGKTLSVAILFAMAVAVAFVLLASPGKPHQSTSKAELAPQQEMPRDDDLLRMVVEAKPGQVAETASLVQAYGGRVESIYENLLQYL